MSVADIANVTLAGVGVVTILGSAMAVIFNVGSLKGQITALLKTFERDRTDMLKDIGRIEERFERHIDVHEQRRP